MRGTGRTKGTKGTGVPPRVAPRESVVAGVGRGRRFFAMTHDPSSRAIFATKGERHAALRARLAGDGETESPPPVDPVDPPADDAPPPAVSAITQGVRAGPPGPGPPDVDTWIRDMAHRRTGSGGIWTIP
jgi:hypothetical protein